jgi:hypothetical protein
MAGLIGGEIDKEYQNEVNIKSQGNMEVLHWVFLMVVDIIILRKIVIKHFNQG